ncbi:MAG: glutamate--tRNA ligase, partial [Vicinamibacterales bacterium]
MRLRFAPSPTGHLHVGNARTALFNWLLARRHNGTFILRIEDTDAERSTTASERSIVEDLEWLGLQWDEGPDVGGALGPYRQSERGEIYRAHADRLLGGGQAYRCFCSPDQIEADRLAARARGEQPRYSGRCRRLDPEEVRRRLADGERAAIRFAVQEGPDVRFSDSVRGDVQFARAVIGDPVIVRSDGSPAYNFAVVVDDALMAVTDVIRGEDHISNTPRQLLLYEALGYPSPRFAHLSLVLGPDQAPLSKRHGATSVAEFRSLGILPEALVNYLALLGWSPGDNLEILPRDEMVRRFAIEDVGKTAGVFDPDKLAWMNRHYIREASPSRVASLLEPYCAAAGFCRVLSDEGRTYAERYLVPLVAGAVSRLDEAPARIASVFASETDSWLQQEDVRRELEEPAARSVCVALATVLAEEP